MVAPEAWRHGPPDLRRPLQDAVAAHGASTAVVAGDRRVSYAELARRVGALGAGLDALGLERGDRVGVLALNSLAHVECFLAIPAHGRVIVDLNVRLAGAELAELARGAELRALVCDTAHLEAARQLRAACPQLATLVFDGAAPCPADCVAYEQLVAGAPAAAPAVGEHELAAISFTGGTTGRSKGVMLSHGNLVANARHNLAATGHAATDRWLHVCPMFHAAGTANVLAATWAGALQVVLPRFDAAAVAAAIPAQEITHVALVPTMVGLLLDHDAASPADLSGLRHLQYAASPISPALLRRLLDRLPCDVVQFYGMTEAAPTLTCNNAEDHRRGHAGEPRSAERLASMGRPVEGVAIELRDPAGARVAAGEVGEIWARGPNIMLGYWRDPEATRAALVDGWYRTGDAARADADGYLFMVDRLKDMIISGGENVYSVEVENVLTDHPAVAEAAVFGVPDERWGERVHAVLVTHPGEQVDVDALLAHCRARIAGYKIPRSVELRSTPLPKSGAGKLLKAELRRPFWAGRPSTIG